MVKYFLHFWQKLNFQTILIDCARFDPSEPFAIFTEYWSGLDQVWYNLRWCELLMSPFHDAIPKFARRADAAPADALTPILHGKAMLATSADATKGIFVVGSPNFGQNSQIRNFWQFSAKKPWTTLSNVLNLVFPWQNLILKLQF